MAGREELMNECIVGIGHYAAQQVKDNYFSSKSEEVRVLIETLYDYYGLDNGDDENAPSLDDILDKYDEQIHAAKYRNEVGFVSSEYKVGAIFGLYRYGEDMVESLGDVAMSDILDMGDMMKEIAMYWDFKPYDIVVDLSERLRAEVRNMLEATTLPGQPASGINVGYHIRQAILFNNDRGFVLAHHPKAPAPYVTWTFTDRNGERGYDVGNYFSTEERAKLSYISRVTDYIETYKVTEKSIPTAATEEDVEQNYNMIDGVRNNQDFPKPDLTDGQTDAEIRELAPEMLPDETVGEDRRIPVQIMSEGQPTVTVTFSENEELRGIEKLPLYLADLLFAKIDALPRDERGDNAPYYKTDFRINSFRNDEFDVYIGHCDVGDGGGSLLNHIQENAEFCKRDAGYQQYLEDKGERNSVNAHLETILEELVPFYKKHCEISQKEAAAISELMEIHEDAAGDPSDSAKVRIEYLEAVVENAWRLRAALNGTELAMLPEQPHPAVEAASDKSGRDDKSSVLDKIKASRTTPKIPPKPKQGRDKKSQGPEL